MARALRAGRSSWPGRSGRAPKHCPHKTESRVAELLIAARETHPQWGARKLLRVLSGKHPDIRTWPAPSTVADLLARRGLVHRRRPHRKPVHPGVVRPVTDAPNDLWT